MNATGGFLAYGSTRARALRSTLLRTSDILALRVADDAALFLRAAQSLGFSLHDETDTRDTLAKRLISRYETMLRSCPRGRDLFLALVRFHEIENLKLLWRVTSRGVRSRRWEAFWFPLGGLETIAKRDARRGTTVHSLAESLEATPYGDVVLDASRAHPGDSLSAEIAFDRWGSQRALDACNALAAGERRAAGLVESMVAERDFELLRRGESRGLTSRVSALSSVLLSRRYSAASLARIAEWRPERGPLWRELPHELAHRLGTVTSWDELFSALRVSRRRAAMRAFIGETFRLAPAAGLLVLAEGELSALTALLTARGDATVEESVTRRIAASLMGA